MLDNNLLFSFILSLINIAGFYLIKNNDEKEIDYQGLLMLFSITFVSAFLLKYFSSGDFMKGGSETVLSHSTRAPF